MDYGIKVVAEGKDVSTTDLRDILMSSKYSMLKFHSDTTTSLTLTPGDTDKYVEVSHTLGYVPAFIAYIKFDGKEYFIPSLPRAGGFSEYAYAWSSSSVIRCGYAFPVEPYNQQIIEAQGYWCTALGGSPLFVLFGKGNDGTYGSNAIRFTGINLTQNQSITAASLELYVEQRNVSGGGNAEIKVYGIDEDNTGALDSGAVGRTKTSAATDQSISIPGLGEYYGIDVKGQVEEIIARGGWSSGNAMGFITDDDGTPNNNYYIFDEFYAGSSIRLKITKGGNATVDFRVIIFKDKLA